MMGKNLLWTLTDNAVGKKPLNFVYTAVNSTDSFDGLGKIVVNVSVHFFSRKSHLQLCHLTINIISSLHCRFCIPY